MADDQGTAETPAEVTTPINDGIIDLDAPATAETPEGDGEKPEGEPDPAGEKKAGEEEPPKKPSGAARAKIREQRLLTELSARDRELEELRSKVPAVKAGDSE